MRKSFRLIPIMLVGLTLTSCDNVPEDIRAFIDTFDYDRAYLNTNKALLTLSYEIYDLDNNLTDYNYTTYYFSKIDEDNLIVNEIGEYSGSYAESNECESYMLVMAKDEGTYIQVEVLDSETTSTIIDEDIVLEEIEDFFYRSDASGIKTYGYFYGEDIENVISNQYAYFSLIEEGTCLRYGVGELELEDSIINLTYSVNKYGMLYYWEQEIYGEDTFFHGTITISYNEEVNYEEI